MLKMFAFFENVCISTSSSSFEDVEDVWRSFKDVEDVEDEMEM